MFLKMICRLYLKICIFLTIGFLAVNQPKLVGAQNETQISITAQAENIVKQAMAKENLEYLKKIGNIVENTGVFIPKVSTAFKSINAIWNILKATHTLMTGEELEEKKDTDKTSKVIETSKKIEGNTYIINDKVDKIPEKIGQESNIDLALNTIFENVETVYSYFIDLSDLVNINDKKKLSDFCESIIKPTTGVQQNIRDIYSNMYKNDDIFFTLLKNTELAEEMMCKNKRPTMHLLYRIYSSVTLTEVKALLILQYAGNFTNDFDIRFHQNGMRRRLTDLRRKIQNAMLEANEDFWACEGPGIEGGDYGKLSAIFSVHISREDEMAEVTGTEGHMISVTSHAQHFYYCSTFSQVFPSKLARVYHSELTKKFGNYQNCDGVLRNCDQYANLNQAMTVCVAEEGSGRKYNKVKIGDVTHGSDNFCNNETTLPKPSFTWPLKGINERCMCICDEYYMKNDTNRYFNLRPITSDIQNNRVITGARIVIKDKMVQFEIQEGKLMKYGNINKKTLQWRGNSFNITDPGVEENVDYHRITWDHNRVNLDELTVPFETLLTGLKFEVEQGVLKLAIRYTDFNFTEGILDYNYLSLWYSEDNDIPNRKGPVNTNSNVPTSSARHRPNQYKTGFIRFNISSIETDVGQNIVPYIDLQSLTLNPPIPLSEASLIHKSSLNDAGYLALKLTAYNYAPELPLDETYDFNFE